MLSQGGVDKLSEEEHNEILFYQQEYLLEDSSPEEQPIVTLLAGQPGAGKSRLYETVKKEVYDGYAVPRIDIDVLRHEHPRYDYHMRSTPSRAAELVQHDAS
ncbi:MAG: zeta toxin family protein, partial [Opitutae bacterium]